MKFVREDAVTSGPAPLSQFTDGVWRAEILDAVREGGLRAHRFVYAPGARSSWHTHQGEQAIFVISGRGVLMRSGESAATPIGPGDWVHIEPGEKHWHGSASDDTLVHLAVTASGGTDWESPVSDDEYMTATSDLTGRSTTPTCGWS